ncbi:DNA repair exonuclease [Granulosicoccaceae sp. 1_MG-2023]|nr:DNA repair exonuclease [Granulosicoccaceae sp. 1_MG-2023]
MEFRFIHAADLHLDSPLHGLERYEGAPVEAIRSATRQAFEALVELAIEREVSLVLLAGDIYDGDWKDFSTGLYLVKQLKRLGDAGIEVCLISGNHDAQSQMTKRLPWPDNVCSLSVRKPETRLYEGLKVAVHGQGFVRREVTDDLTEHYPTALPGYLNIGLLHTSLDGKPGHAPYAPCTVEGLRRIGYDYWALGHVHQREIVSTDPWIVYPGNIQGRHIRETGPKGCTLVTVRDGRISDVSEEVLDVLRWAALTVDAGGISDRDVLEEAVITAVTAAMDEAAGRLLACRVRLEGATDLHAWLVDAREEFEASLRARLSGEAVWLQRAELATQLPLSTAGRDEAAAGLLAYVQSLHEDGAQRDSLLAGVAAELKLPRDIAVDDEQDLTHPENLPDAQKNKLLDDALALILNRLGKGAQA